MKIPKYVQELLDKRCDYAEKLSIVSSELDDWLEKNNIKCEDCDICTGCEIYVNPRDSKLRIMEAIRSHPTEKKAGVPLKKTICLRKYIKIPLFVCAVNVR